MASKTADRWKRGFAALIIVALPFLTAGAACGVVAFALEAANSDRWQAVGIVITAIAVLPWLIGDRKVLRHLGGLGRAADD